MERNGNLNYLQKARGLIGIGMAISVWALIVAVIMIICGIIKMTNVGLIVGGVLLLIAGVILAIMLIKKHKKILSTC